MEFDGPLNARSRHPRCPSAWLLAVALIAGACGEPGIDEALHLELRGDGTSEVRYEVEVPALDGGRSGEYVDRLEEERRAYLQGWDPWERRFRESGAVEEWFGWQKLDGRLARLSRSARYDGPDGLERFFSDTDLAVLLFPGEGEAEFSIRTAPSTRATGEQEEQFEERREAWSRAAVAYLEEVERFFALIDSRPARAPYLYTAIFTDREPRLTATEERHLESLVEAFGVVMEHAARAPDERFGLDELARLIYDPFPAPLSVEVDGVVIEAVGFTERVEGGWEVSSLGMERALEELERIWVEPPLLTTYARVTEGGESFDAEEFATRPRSMAEIPTAAEVVERLDEVLTPLPEYRLLWRPLPPPAE